MFFYREKRKILLSAVWKTMLAGGMVAASKTYACFFRGRIEENPEEVSFLRRSGGEMCCRV